MLKYRIVHKQDADYVGTMAALRQGLLSGWGVDDYLIVARYGVNAGAKSQLRKILKKHMDL